MTTDQTYTALTLEEKAESEAAWKDDLRKNFESLVTNSHTVEGKFIPGDTQCSPFLCRIYIHTGIQYALVHSYKRQKLFIYKWTKAAQRNPVVVAMRDFTFRPDTVYNFELSAGMVYNDGSLKGIEDHCYVAHANVWELHGPTPEDTEPNEFTIAESLPCDESYPGPQGFKAI